MSVVGYVSVIYDQLICFRLFPIIKSMAIDEKASECTSKKIFAEHHHFPFLNLVLG